MFLPALLLFSCNSGNAPDFAVVSGTINSAGGETLKFEEIKPDKLILIDSLILDNTGSFTFKTLPAHEGFYLLRIGDENPISLVLGKGDSIQVFMDKADHRKTYQIRGNHDCNLLQDFYHETGILQTKIDSLGLVLFESKHLDSFYLINTEIEIALQKLMDGYRIYADSLIKNNTTSLASILIINQRFAGEPLFKIEDVPDLFVSINEDLSKKLPDNPHVAAHQRRVEEYQSQRALDAQNEIKISSGNIAPEISLPDVDGNLRALKDLRGNFVVLLFWASWSPESRADIQLLKKTYATFKDKGLEVYSISMDHKKKFWKAVVDLEGLQWVNVSDLSGIEGPVGNLFMLKGKLPYYFLLDKNGVILQKTSDYTELENAISEIFGSKSD